jgi:polyhydroxybutyrate depolymerase
VVLPGVGTLSGFAGVLIAAAATAGTSAPPATPCERVGASETRCESLAFDGHERTYRLYVPARVARAAPVLLVLHPALFRGATMQAITAGGFDRRADATGALIVYPDGVDQHWNDGREATPAARAHIDDVGFLRALVVSLGERHTIDRARIFVTGFSNGGMMTLRLACEAADLFTGFVAVAASLGDEMARQCHPQPPRPVALIDGTSDALVPYAGGKVGLFGSRGHVVGAEATFTEFRELAGCGTSDTQPGAGEAGRNPPEILVHRAHGCPPGISVALFEVRGGGHAWPGGARVSPQVVLLRGTLSHAIDATDEAWRFFGLDAAPLLH